MQNEEDVQRVGRLIARYVESPSRSHIRHPKSVERLAHDILRELADRNPAREKWSKEREALALKASVCWIPREELRAALNALPGPPLTSTDLDQRLKDFVRGYVTEDPKPEFEDHCRKIYESEKSEGTEFAAIVGVISDWVDAAYREIFRKQLEEDEKRKAEARQAKEHILLSGVDCGWTSIGGSKVKWCRIGGRTFRGVPMEQQAPGKGGKKMIELHRVKTTDRDEAGILIGSYESFSLAAEIARQLIANRDPKIR